MSGPADTGPAVDPDLYRKAIGRLASGVTVVTTKAGRHDHAMTATAVVSVSLVPVLLVVSVERDSRWHEAVSDSGVFGVNLLTAAARRDAEWLSSPGRPMHGQLDRIAHHHGAATGVALLEGALAHFECRVSDIHPAGDHSLVVGQVCGLHLPEVATDPALVHYRGRFESLH